MMSAFLTATSTLRISPGIPPIYTRNPAVIAATWSTMWNWQVSPRARVASC
ncbi:MAG: hypothetical protein ACLFWD_07410 [Anaerolineales bacterium]